MKIYQSIVCIAIALILVFPVSMQAKAVTYLTLTNASITVVIDSNGYPQQMTTSKVPMQSIGTPTTEFLFYGGGWNSLPSPNTLIQTSPTSYQATYIIDGYSITVKGELKSYPALVMTYYVTNNMESSSRIGFQFSVDYNSPSHVISPWNVKEPIFIQSSATPLSWTTSVPSRYNGTNVIITAEDAKSWDYQSISSTVGKTAVVAGPWSSIHSNPALSSGMVHISAADNAYGVQLLDAPIASGATISFKIAIGMDVSRPLAYVWGLISVK
jgi:hypothetical protein